MTDSTDITDIAVVVPAADEESTIGPCLEALVRATEHLRLTHPDVRVQTVVALDRCTDLTAEIVADYAVHSTVCDARSVGVARQQGTDEALKRVSAPLARVWIAHTDADSQVPSDWLVTQIRSADAGADVVVGAVVPDLTGPALIRWAVAEADDAGDPPVHGANLGIRADLLARLGGWPPLESGEDVALVDRAQALGAVVAPPRGGAVRTSARRAGRAPTGFSSYLRALDRDELDPQP